VAFQHRRRSDEHVHGRSFTRDLAVQLSRHLAPVGAFGHDDQQVDVALDVRLLPRPRAKEQDAQRLHGGHDVAHEPLDDGLIDRRIERFVERLLPDGGSVHRREEAFGGRTLTPPRRRSARRPPK
jgi:hypothetical protein